MQISELNTKMSLYMVGETDRSFVDDQMMRYKNEYIMLRRVASSNKWVGVNTLIKQWSIIYSLQKPFGYLQNFRELNKYFDIKITPVSKGEFKGCWGIRIYGMTKNPDRQIVNELLDYIFQK